MLATARLDQYQAALQRVGTVLTAATVVAYTTFAAAVSHAVVVLVIARPSDAATDLWFVVAHDATFVTVALPKLAGVHLGLSRVSKRREYQCGNPCERGRQDYITEAERLHRITPVGGHHPDESS